MYVEQNKDKNLKESLNSDGQQFHHFQLNE